MHPSSPTLFPQPPRTLKLFVTFLGIGNLPKAPGTWAAAAALIPAAALVYLGGILLLGLAIVLVTIAAIPACTAYCRTTGKDDACEIVIDEVIGVWIAVLILPQTFLAWALGFVFFRLFDILKPGPVAWAEQGFDGGLGVMADDVVAGILAAMLSALILVFLTNA